MEMPADGHTGQMEDLGFRKFQGTLPIHGLPFKKEMPGAEEVYIIMRELHGFDPFRWKQWRQACAAVLNPSRYAQRQGSFNMTVCNMLRAQVKAGHIVRLRRGVYAFSFQLGHRPAARPLYVNAFQFKLRPD